MDLPLIRESIDVLVVGAGPVGLFCANELARHGLSCRIIDKKDALNEHSRALGIHIRTLDVLQDTGFIDAFLAQGLAVPTVQLKSGGSRLASIDFKGIGASRDFLLDLPQDKSERILFQGLVDKGIEVEWQSELVALEQKPDDVLALVQRPGDQTESIRARWLIACDGAHSTVRHLLKAEFPGSAYEQHWWLADLHIQWSLPDDHMIINAGPHGPLACFPMGDKRYRLVLTAPDNQTEPDMNDIRQAFDKRSSDKAQLSDPVWITPFSIHHRQIQQYRHDRVFFCGDAAHIHSPMGGQGLNTGIQDVYNLVWKLALVKQRHCTDALLDSYHAERYPVGKAILEKTDKMTRLILLRNRLLIALRNGIIRLLGSFERVRHAIARDLSELNITYTNSPIVKTLGKHTGLKAGDYLPNGLLKNLNDRTHLNMREICEGTRHHLFLFVGLADRVTKTSLKASVIAPRFSRVLDVHLILLDTPETYPESLSLWLDTQRSIHQQFRLEEPTALLVRPDKYIALVQSPINLVELQFWLHACFTNP